MSDLSVSIIMPAFNSAEFIAESIASVIAQSHQNWELLVVDDGSSDTTAAIVEELSREDPRIKLIELGENSGGPAQPRNVGLGLAKSDYIAFLDADDIWLEQKLDFQLSAMSEAGLDFSATRIKKFAHGFDHSQSYDAKSDVSLSEELLLQKNIVANSSVVVSAPLAKRMRRVDLPG